MPSNLRMIRVRDFIRLTPQGSLDFNSLKQELSGAASVPGAFSDYDLLVDTRGAESHLSVFDIWELARELDDTVHASASKRIKVKISLLVPVKEFDHAKFFELCAENRGLNVRAFTSFEDVFEWLSESSTPSSS